MMSRTLTPYLKVGWIYEIDPAAIVPSGKAGSDMVLYNPLKSNNIKYIAIKGKTPQGPAFIYDIQTLDDSFNDKPIIGPTPGRRGETMRYATTASSKSTIPMVTIVRPIANIESAELDKQRAALTQQVATQSGLPVRPGQGPLKDILEYAGLNEVRPRIAGRKKTRKSKKSKRTTHKRK